MAEYKGIKGFKTQSYATDPVTAVAAGGTWASANNLNVVRESFLACAGTQTAGLVAGNYGTTPYAVSEEYDGTSWAAGNPLLTARSYLGGCGTQTAALAVFGLEPPSTESDKTEQYDGTSWSQVGTATTGRHGAVGIGITTAALAVGGITTSRLDVVESYNG